MTGDDPRHQPMGSMSPGDTSSGYHMDLTGVAGSYGPPHEADAWLELLAARREAVMPVTVLQLGLGAWQRSLEARDADASGWRDVARDVATWAVLDMDGHGRFTHHRPMPHTYDIPAPWHSAMAQGLGVSLLVRHGLVEDAARACESLLDPSFGLVADTVDGRVLEEYPATPFPHVLNGWMWALFGLYDLSHATAPADSGAATSIATSREEFTHGVASLAAQLPSYETGRGWSTYDRYPHPIANVASPFYHRLHVEMLRALARIAGDRGTANELHIVAGRWEASLHRPVIRAAAVARKVGFRLVRPRGRAA